MSLAKAKSLTTNFGPPRPCAIATVVDFDDESEMGNTQSNSIRIDKQKKNEEFKMASLYSLLANTKNAQLMQEQKKPASMSSTHVHSYPPEIVIVVAKFESHPSHLQSSKLSSQQRRRRERRERIVSACRCMSTRLVEVCPRSLLQAGDTISQTSHVNHTWMNKMAMIATLFRQSVYQSIAYIDCQHCLVRKDISHLFTDFACNENRPDSPDSPDDSASPSSATQQPSSLISAVPKLQMNKHHLEVDSADSCDATFNSSNSFETSVMLLRPSLQTYLDLITIAKRHTASNDEASNAFVETVFNEYFQTEWSKIALRQRLGIEYNYHLSKATTENNNDDPKILRHSNNVYIYNNDINNSTTQPPTTHENFQHFNHLCQKLYNKSISYIENEQVQQQLKHKANLEAQQRTQKQLHRQKQLQQHANTAKNTNQTKQKQMQKHRLVSKRYKQLRKEGNDPKQAMVIARKEYGMDDDDKKSPSPSSQVASMFGMGGMV